MKQEIRDRIDNIKSGKVPNGFKKTKVGIIPKDWDIINANDAFDLIGGNAFKSSDSKEKGIRWLKIANVDIGNIKWETVDHLPSEFVYQYPEYLLQENDIVMALTRPILNGKLKIAYIKKYDAPSLLNQRVGKIKPRKNVNDKYIYHYLSKSSTVSSLETIIAGTDPPNLGKGDLDKLDIVYPNYAEQQKIASILSTWDKAIELKENLIEEKKKQKKGLMQKLLTGEVRLPGFNGEWKEVRLGKHGATFNGLSGKTAGDFGTGKPFITYMNVFSNSEINIKQVDYVDIRDNESQFKVQHGDIFFTTSSETPGEVCMSSVLLEQVNEMYLNSFCFGYRLNDLNTILPEFMRFYLRGYFFRKEVYKLAQGSTRFNISKNEVMKLKINVPDIAEQKEIASILTTSDKEISFLVQELEVLKLQKKGLMQLLLTGIVRVNTEN